MHTHRRAAPKGPARGLFQAAHLSSAAALRPFERLLVMLCARTCAATRSPGASRQPICSITHTCGFAHLERAVRLHMHAHSRTWHEQAAALLDQRVQHLSAARGSHDAGIDRETTRSMPIHHVHGYPHARPWMMIQQPQPLARRSARAERRRRARRAAVSGEGRARWHTATRCVGALASSAVASMYRPDGT